MSIGSTHRVAGLYAGAGLGLAAGWPLWQITASAVIASATAHGPTSPDSDQSWMQWTGRHRGITHWPGWVLLVMAFVPAPLGTGWAVTALAAGWSSHLILDSIWGKNGIPWLPVAPWWYFGLGFRCEGTKKYTTIDWAGERIETSIPVGRSERLARRIMQWGLVPLGTWIVISPAILPALVEASGR